MGPHHLPLVLVERPRLADDVLGDADLPDVVEERADLDRLEVVVLVAQLARELDRDGGDPFGVPTGVGVFRLDAAGKCGDRVAVRAPQLEVRLADLLDCARGSFEVLPDG